MHVRRPCRLLKTVHMNSSFTGTVLYVSHHFPHVGTGALLLAVQPLSLLPLQVRTGVLLVQQEGVVALWAGLPPALARGFLYGGLRLGLYSPLKDAIAGLGGSGTEAAGSGTAAAGGAPPPQLSFVGKLLAGSLSGGVAAAITNPTELVKVGGNVFFPLTLDSNHPRFFIIASEPVGGPVLCVIGTRASLIDTKHPSSLKVQDFSPNNNTVCSTPHDNPPGLPLHCPHRPGYRPRATRTRAASPSFATSLQQRA